MGQLEMVVAYRLFMDVLFFLSVYGVATIISTEYIFAPFVDLFKRFEKLYYLLNCNKCMSVWIGGLTSLFYWTVLTPVLDAAICYVVAAVLNKFLDEPTI